jgi:hypothetical protein
MAVRELK